MQVPLSPEGGTFPSVGDAELLAAIVDSSGDAILSVTLAGEITSANAAASSLFGFGADELVGAALAKLEPDGVEQTRRHLARVAAGEQIPAFEATRLCKDGRPIAVSMTIAPVRDREGAVVGAATISQDVSARRAAELALAEVRADLEQRNRLLARSNSDLEQFASVASHDLAEPLRTVSGMVQLLERRYAGRLDQDADEFIGFAVEGCERMSALINDLLEYARVAAEDPEIAPVDLNQTVSDVIESLGARIGETGATVTVESLPTVSGSARQLGQVLANLVSNALKFHRPGEAPEVLIGATRRDRDWVVAVTDNGLGIEPQYRDRVFKVFRRLHTRDAYGGTGIGLAICQRIVEAGGGEIWIDDGPDGGAQFSFSIPD